MLRHLLEQGREAFKKQHRVVVEKVGLLQPVQEKKKTKKKKKRKNVQKQPKNASEYRNFKLVFDGNRLTYIPRNDGQNEWDEEDWDAMKKMADVVWGNLEHAKQELKDEMKRLQGRLVLKDYSIWNDANDEYVSSKKRKEEGGKVVPHEEEEEEDSDTGGSGED